MRRLWIVAALIALASMACGDRFPSMAGGRDAAPYVLPDSGMVYDGGPSGPRYPDAAPADTGPHQCNPGCDGDAGQVCACLTSGAGNCGCHPRQDYLGMCDPQVPKSCRWPHECVRSRTPAGTSYVCSDGREGAPCAREQSMCNTRNGCVCLSTPFGISCSCQGEGGMSPLYCDPLRPEVTCPEGTCVRVEGQSGVFHLCSDGSDGQPCERGDNSCRTSLGCTCPLASGRPRCQCSEPGTMAGVPCDLDVTGACVAPLTCELTGNPVMGGLSSQCTSSGAGDPYACDPMRPMCPNNFRCVEVEPGVYRCRP